MVILMLIGVFAFSFASGSLASIMQNYDSQQAVINERLMLLDNIAKNFNFSEQLHEDLKNALSFEAPKANEDLEELMKSLPHRLRSQVIAEVHKDLENSFSIFHMCNENKINLLQWISQKLDPQYLRPKDTLYCEP